MAEKEYKDQTLIEYAGLLRRAVALLVDQASLVLFMGLFCRKILFCIQYLFVLMGAPASVLCGFRVLSGYALVALYYTILHSSRGGGKTLGKRLTGIAVRDLSGNKLSAQRSFIRFVVFFLPLYAMFPELPWRMQQTNTGRTVEVLALIPGLIVFLLAIINRPSGRTLHDYAAGTVVVRRFSPGGTVDGKPGRITIATTVLLVFLIATF